MKGFDAFAGVIKSGGKTRRAAKMVILNVDHPDIVEFISCKANEEKKAWALIDAGYDGSFTGEAYESVFFQNSNNSVRVTDDFMEAVRAATARGTTRAVRDRRHRRDLPRARPVARRSPRRRGSAAIPACSSTPPSTTGTPRRTRRASTRRTRAREYMFLDDSACNLASLNLRKFQTTPSGELRRRGVPARRRDHHPGAGDHRRQRQVPDGEDRRELARASGRSASATPTWARCSCRAACPTTRTPGARLRRRHHRAHVRPGLRARQRRIARDVTGPFDGYAENREPFLGVMEKHRTHVDKIDARAACPYDLHDARRATPWDETLAIGTRARLPQRPGHRAGADRHHRLHDGLRHHRHRARHRARQVQAAGRRRHAQDRQQHGARGAGQARLRRGRRRKAIVDYINEQGDHRGRARPEGRAPAGVRLRLPRRRTARARSTTWATSG